MDRELPLKDVEELIISLLEACPLCVLATCSGNVPRASTVEFFPIGTTLYILTEGGKKIENIRHNPHVSVAVHAGFTGWQDVKGLQISGVAEIGEAGSAIFDEAIRAYKKRRSSQDTVSSLPAFMHVIRVTPAKLEYLDASLAERGYKVRHTLSL